MGRPFRWGILGTGRIARKFVAGLAAAPGAQAAAVGSRTAEKAEAFGRECDIPRRYGSYEALAGDPEVDAIYVATPHPFHARDSIMSLNAGKAVLCEKPFALNAREAEEAVAVARGKRLFLMEAMWTRFLPLTVKVRNLLAMKAVGDVRMFKADFGFRAGWDPQGRLLNPALGGGALLDVGVYTLSYASMIFGPPRGITGAAHIGETGVDEQAAILLSYGAGRLAVLTCATRTDIGGNAVICGADGWMRLEPSFWNGSRMLLAAGGRTQEILCPIAGNGMNYEAKEVMRCVRDGRIESTVMPLDETVQIMRTMDAIRAKWGLRYPSE